MEKLSVGNFSVPMVPLAWDPGKGFGFGHLETGFSPERAVLPLDLQELRTRVVAEREAQGGRTLFDGRTVELVEFDIGFVEEDGEKMVLGTTFREGRYFNNLATHLVLDRELTSGVTVRQKYAPDFDVLQTPEGYKRSVLPMLVGCSSVLVTEDNRVLLTIRSRGVAVVAGLHHVSLAEGMRPEDLDEGGAPNPFLAIVRGLREEVGVDLDIEDIVITALGMSQQYLQPDFASMVVTSKTAKQVVAELPAKARDRWENQSVFFAEWSPRTIAPLLFERQWSPHASFSLLMGLLHEFGYDNTEQALR